MLRQEANLNIYIFGQISVKFVKDYPLWITAAHFKTMSISGET